MDLSARERKILLGALAAFALGGCSEPAPAALDGGPSDAGRERPTEAGVADSAGARADDAGETDLDTGLDTAIEPSCRAVSGEPSAVGDGGVEATDAGFFISGTVSGQGDCLSGVRVCTTCSEEFGWQAESDHTDPNGRFEIYEDGESCLGYGIVVYTVTPRMVGYRFEPPSMEVTLQGRDEISGLRFEAIEIGIPDHATGRWKVIEDTCPEGLPLAVTGISIFTNQTGEQLAFEQGCLFGGIGCVDGLTYSDEQAFCSSFTVMTPRMGVGPTSSAGQFEPTTGRWRINQQTRYSDGSSPKTFVKEMVLERAQ